MESFLLAIQKFANHPIIDVTKKIRKGSKKEVVFRDMWQKPFYKALKKGFVQKN